MMNYLGLIWGQYLEIRILKFSDSTKGALDIQILKESRFREPVCCMMHFGAGRQNTADSSRLLISGISLDKLPEEELNKIWPHQFLLNCTIGCTWILIFFSFELLYY